MSPELALEDGEIDEIAFDNGATERYVV
jgi:hypothetical protein